MMNVVAGERSTKIQMLVYTLLLFSLTLSPYFFGFAGVGYAFTAAVLSGFFVYTALRVLSSPDLKYAKRMFGYSVFYLFALFLAVMAG